ncbi:MAG: flavin reductase family protein [Paracoccaceae bacterium]|nr:flavin reductase family protein [Paracoccaceae bacterium]MDG2257435.1 flavin reductase family protein [Paracoccaceae bacterium]
MTNLDPRALRSAFGSFMTGVTVVTARDESGTPVGFTANSFSSVSLDPPLLLVCPGKFLSSYEAFTNCREFAVSVLAEGQEEISNTFASFKGDRFSKVSHSIDVHGVPVIDDAVVQFSCKTNQVMTTGDHSILLGEVREFTHNNNPGLGYSGGQYFSLGLERAASETTSGTAVCGAIIAQGDHVLLERTPDGFRPLQITRNKRQNMRAELHTALTAQNLRLEIGPAYSVFDDPATNHHFTYFLASGSTTMPNAQITAVPINKLATVTYTTDAIAVMMSRYALESQTRNFALYLGDAQHGDVHALNERT